MLRFSSSVGISMKTAAQACPQNRKFYRPRHDCVMFLQFFFVPFSNLCMGACAFFRFSYISDFDMFHI